MKDFSQSLVAVSLFASNILFWKESGYFDTAAELKPLLHTWSLAVEEQYYLLFPLFLLAMWRFAKRWTVSTLAVIAILSFAVAQWGAYNKPAATFFLLPTRGWEIAIGALAAFYFARYPRLQLQRSVQETGSFIGLLLILYAVFAYSKETPFPSAYALAPTLGAALIILCTTPSTLVGRVLTTKAFVGIGLISYSAYLWHQPLFAFAHHALINSPSQKILLSLCVLTFALAYLSWRFVEIPIRKGAYAKGNIFKLTLGVTFCFAALGLVGHLKNGYVDYYSDSVAKKFEAVKSEKHGQSACWDLIRVSRSIAGACSIGDPQQKPSFAVVGDSHAGSLIYGANLLALKNKQAGKNFTFTSCPPVEASRSVKQDETQKTCNALRSSLFQALGGQSLPEVLVLASRWTLKMEQSRFNNQEGGIESGERSQWINSYSDEIGYKAALAQDYKDSVLKMLDNGHRVVLIYPIPEMGWDVPNRLMKLYKLNSEINSNDASISHQVFRSRNNDTYRALDDIGTHKNLLRVYPEKIFCNSVVSDRCVAHINGEPLFYDDDHVTAYGGRLIFEEVQKVLSW